MNNQRRKELEAVTMKAFIVDIDRAVGALVAIGDDVGKAIKSLTKMNTHTIYFWDKHTGSEKQKLRTDISDIAARTIDRIEGPLIILQRVKDRLGGENPDPSGGNS